MKHLKFSYAAQLRLLLLPYLLGALVLVAAPALITVLLAFTGYDALSPPVWRGWDNWRLIFNDLRLPRALFNTAYFVVLAVPLRVGAALVLALWLHPPRRGVGVYRAAVYLPSVIPDVAYALVWLWVLNPVYGPLNLTLTALGLPAPAWLLDPLTAKPALVFMSLFQIGEGFVILLAGRRAIPEAYYDAARVEGARPWQLFWHLTWPLLRPWLVLLTLRDIVLSVQTTFNQALLMTNGDPYYSTLFLPLLAYEEAFSGLRLGEASAMLVLMFGGVALLLGLFAFMWRRRELEIA